MTKTTNKPRHHLSPNSSWVLATPESDEDLIKHESADDSPPDLASTSASPKTRPKRRLHRRQSAETTSYQSVEPELVMPTLEKESPRRRTAPRQRQSAGETSAAHPQTKRRAEKKQLGGLNLLSSAWDWVLCPMLNYVTAVLSLILDYFKPILAFFVVSWLLFILLRRPLTSVVSVTIERACQFPAVAYLGLPFCALTAKATGPVEFDQLMTVQSAFEDVLASSSVGAALPLDMKRGESSIRDLKYVVQYSSLPSRNELVFEFTGFVDTARQASTDLTRFNSRIGRAVDQVLSINRWTLQVLDGLEEREAARGSVARFFQNSMLVPFWPGSFAKDLVVDQYLRHTRAVEDQIAELILEAQALLGILHNLDNRLDVIHEITTRDGVKLKGTRDELLAQLWTWLGGNRSSMKKNKEQLDLLRDVSIYRKTAWDHVSATILKLQSIAAGLEDLRERVGASDVAASQTDIPLSVHIHNIQMGVERLQAQRQEARDAENNKYRSVIDKNAHGDRKLLE